MNLYLFIGQLSFFWNKMLWEDLTENDALNNFSIVYTLPRTCLPKRCLATEEGYTHRDT
jgi:hypothetical protein